MSSISSITDESYLAALQQLQTIRSQQTNTQTSIGAGGDTDCYISSVSDADEVIPTGIYNASGLEVGTDNSASQEATGASGSGGAGGGGSSDSEEETTTEIVTINGVTYLQTTTTDENGNTTVTRTEIG